jgi:primosomal protein N' (replication factor Y)
MRKALCFPPYSRLIRFVIRAKDRKRADDAIKRLSAIVGDLAPSGNTIELLGPCECPIGMISDNHRRQLILRSPSMGAIHSLARDAVFHYEKGRDSKTYLEIDVDPVSML